MSRKVASAVYLVFPCFSIFPSSRQSRLWSDSSPQKMPWFQVQVRTCTLLPPIHKEVRRRCCIFYFFLGTEPQAYLIIHHRQPHPSRSCILVGCFGTAWLPVWCFFLGIYQAMILHFCQPHCRHNLKWSNRCCPSSSSSPSWSLSSSSSSSPSSWFSVSYYFSSSSLTGWFL